MCLLGAACFCTVILAQNKNDVFRLSELLLSGSRVQVSRAIWEDLQAFFMEIRTEEMNTKQLGIPRSKKQVLETIANCYERI